MGVQVRTYAWAALLLGSLSGTAAAAPLEAPAEFDVGRDDPQRRAVRYDYSGGGLLLSDDGGETYRLMCGRAIDSGVTRETTGILVGPGGVLFTGEFSGLWKGTADGCAWSAVPELDGLWVSDLRHHPSDPNVLYAITGNGGDAFMNGIYEYDGGADTWTAVGGQASELLRSLRVVELDGGGLRFYEALARGEDAEGRVNYIIRHSEDRAETWTEHAFPTTEGTLRLLAVDPQNPDRIVLSVTYPEALDTADEVLVNDAGGAPDAFVTVGEVATFGGAAFDATGDLWFSDAEGPLFVLRDGATDPVMTEEDANITCLQLDEGTGLLQACKLLEFGAVDVDAGTYATTLAFKDMAAWVTCDGEAVAPACEGDLAETGYCGFSHYPDAPICEAYDWPGLDSPPGGGGSGGGGGGGGVAGGDGDGPDAGVGPDDSDDGGCGCRLGAGAPGRAPATSWLLLAAVVGLWRRRRARR